MLLLLASLAHAAPVQFTFAWPTGMVCAEHMVRTSERPNRPKTEKVADMVLTVSKTDLGPRVTISDVQIVETPESWPGASKAQVAMTQAMSTLDLKADGTFHRLEGLEAGRNQLILALEQIIPRDAPPELKAMADRVVGPMMDPAALEQGLAAEWNDVYGVGFAGVELDPAKPLTVPTAVTNALGGSATAVMVITTKDKVKCGAKGPKTCVEVTAITRPDPGQVEGLVQATFDAIRLPEEVRAKAKDTRYELTTKTVQVLRPEDLVPVSYTSTTRLDFGLTIDGKAQSSTTVDQRTYAWTCKVP